MGRKKIKIEPIQEGRNRQVTYLKRKAGLFKKAYELATLTDSQVAVIVFGHNGKLSQFCSGDMDQVLLKYTEFDGVVETKGPGDFAGLRDDDDDDVDEDEDQKPSNARGGPPGPGSSGGGGPGGSTGGPSFGPSGADGSANARSGSSREGNNGTPGPHSGPNKGSRSSGGNKRKGSHHEPDAHIKEERSPTDGSIDKRTVKAAVLSKRARQSQYSKGNMSERSSEEADELAPTMVDTLDQSSLLAQPVLPFAPHNRNAPVVDSSLDQLRRPSGGYSSPYSHETVPITGSHRLTGARVPSLPTSLQGGHGWGSDSHHPHQQGSVMSNGAPTIWQQPSHGRRNSISTPPEAVFSSMMRPMTADGHLEHSTANQLMALSHSHRGTNITPNLPMSAASSSARSGVTNPTQPHIHAADFYGPNLVRAPGVPIQSQASFSDSSQPHGQQPFHQPHLSSILPMNGLGPTSSVDSLASYARSGSGQGSSGASVSSSSLSLSRPGTDDYNPGSASSAVQTPLMSTTLAASNTSVGDASLGGILPNDFLSNGLPVDNGPMQKQFPPQPIHDGFDATRSFGNGTLSVANNSGMLPPPAATASSVWGQPQQYQQYGNANQPVPATAQSFLPASMAPQP